MKKLTVILVLALFAFSCGEGDISEEVDVPESIENTPTPDKTQNVLALANFTMKVPSEWRSEKPDFNMRIVQYAPTRDTLVKITGFYFGDQPNMVRANIERWKNQFVTVDNFAEETLDSEINFVKITGTYMKKDRPMAQEFDEAEDYVMLAAIVPSNEGPYYFKAVGPKEVMEDEIPVFKKFLKSYTAK